jgi:uncharacterized membrane protein YidH (DUF202 family)
VGDRTPNEPRQGMDTRSLGLVIAGLGAVAVVIGLLIAAGALDWFGRLPGDVRLEGQRTRVYVPIASMLILSVVLTVLLNLLLRR